MESSTFGRPKSIVEGLEQGAQWILAGGNIMCLTGKLNEIPVEVIIRREGFPLPTPEDLQDGGKYAQRVYTLEGLDNELALENVSQIDGVPHAYMEFPIEMERGILGTQNIRTERWTYTTLWFGSHLPDPVARVELLTELLKVIKLCIRDIRNPLIVWRLRPTFESDTDQGVTYLRVRLEIPCSGNLKTLGNIARSAQERGDHEAEVIWCEGEQI